MYFDLVGKKGGKQLPNQYPGSQFSWGLRSPCSKSYHFWICKTLLFEPFVGCHPDSSIAKHLCPTYECMENCCIRSGVSVSLKHSAPSTIRLEIPGWTNKGSCCHGAIYVKFLYIGKIRIYINIRLVQNYLLNWIVCCCTLTSHPVKKIQEFIEHWIELKVWVSGLLQPEGPSENHHQNHQINGP